MPDKAPSKPSPLHDANVAWNSPRLAEVERLLKNHDAAIERLAPKGQHAEAVKILARILGERLSPEELRRLAASFTTTPVSDDSDAWPGFTFLLQETLIRVFLESGDREGLVTLLAARCPQYVGIGANIEFYLAPPKWKLKHPILVLGDAYEKCETAEYRRRIAQAVRQAFAGSGITGESDAEFVRNAMQWYDRNKESLEVNKWYYANTRSTGELRIYKENPLFKPKPPPSTDAKPGGK